ncbi:hypothetical protein CBR_g23500 [Chara braunii]|uniref:Integrase catalytic domain-containing protein n=1 Tax=Chara braunii TaxID=69332 RepID=A0A388L4E2_CHABU|nr:hypothetical protein CBR_g23500 [Chara braunii]|eukprot:GBG77174.1 hypothetical protein CBR_g23500 [Chara braunii]
MGKVSKNGYSQVMVIVDQFSKFLNQVPLPLHAPTELVIREFQQKYILQFGTPKTLVSDRDPRFISTEWKDFTSHLGIRLCMSSGRHPEANGLAEEINQTVFQLLRALIIPDQETWDEELYSVRRLYNDSIHSATGMAPNRPHLGWQICNLLSYLFPEQPARLTPGRPGFRAKYDRLLKVSIAAMTKRQHAMIHQANEGRQPSDIQEGSYVWVKMFEFSEEEGVSRKLLPLYYGQWEVLDVIGEDHFGPSYVVDVPAHLRTYPVFHASKLYLRRDAKTFDYREDMIPLAIKGGHEIDRIKQHVGKGRNRQYQLVPEWKGAYCEYKALKKTLKQITIATDPLPRFPREKRLDSVIQPLLFLLEPHVRRSTTQEAFEGIKVHCEATGNDCEARFVTELLPNMLEKREEELAFFQHLDEQLNKVNDFYKRKEAEFLEHAKLLQTQMQALVKLKKSMRTNTDYGDSPEEDDDDDDHASATQVYEHGGTAHRTRDQTYCDPQVLLPPETEDQEVSGGDRQGASTSATVAESNARRETEEDRKGRQKNGNDDGSTGARKGVHNINGSEGRPVEKEQEEKEGARDKRVQLEGRGKGSAEGGGGAAAMLEELDEVGSSILHVLPPNSPPPLSEVTVSDASESDMDRISVGDKGGGVGPSSMRKQRRKSSGLFSLPGEPEEPRSLATRTKGDASQAASFVKPAAEAPSTVRPRGVVGIPTLQTEMGSSSSGRGTQQQEDSMSEEITVVTNASGQRIAKATGKTNMSYSEGEGHHPPGEPLPKGPPLRTGRGAGWAEPDDKVRKRTGSKLPPLNNALSSGSGASARERDTTTSPPGSQKHTSWGSSASAVAAASSGESTSTEFSATIANTTAAMGSDRTEMRQVRGDGRSVQVASGHGTYHTGKGVLANELQGRGGEVVENGDQRVGGGESEMRGGGEFGERQGVTSLSEGSVPPSVTCRRPRAFQGQGRVGIASPFRVLSRLINPLEIAPFFTVYDNPRRIRHAEKVIGAALVEFYRGMCLLKSFSSLNMAAFGKILKKHDKLAGWKASRTYLSAIEQSAHFTTSTKVTKMIANVENAYTKHFAKDDHRRAMKDLRPISQSASHIVTFFLGFFCGCIVALLASFRVMMYAVGEKDSVGGSSYMESVFPVFSVLILIQLQVFFYGVCVYLWYTVRINYAFIFDFTPGTELGFREVFMIATGMSVIMLAGLIGHLAAYAHKSSHSSAGEFIPAAIILLFMAILVMPFNLFWRSSRMFLLRTLHHVICAPFYKVVLADFFLGDQLTSLIPLLWDIEYVFCYYIGGYFTTRDHKTCLNSIHFRRVGFVLAFLPFWCRMMQCVRRWQDEKQSVHIQNCLKYVCAGLAVGTRLLYLETRSTASFVLGLFFAALATAYGSYWDLFRDWGLLQRGSKNFPLRDQLIWKRKWVYFVSMAVNLILRLAWIQSILRLPIWHLHENVTNLLFAGLEICRRGHWNFYRLENEHINNVGQYRAVKDIPLPFVYSEMSP